MANGISLADLDHIFDHHAPPDDATQEKHATCRSACKRAAAVVINNTPACAEQTKAVRALEQAMFYANAAIARYISAGGGNAQL